MVTLIWHRAIWNVLPGLRTFQKSECIVIIYHSNLLSLYIRLSALHTRPHLFHIAAHVSVSIMILIFQRRKPKWVRLRHLSWICLTRKGSSYSCVPQIPLCCPLTVSLLESAFLGSKQSHFSKLAWGQYCELVTLLKSVKE